MQKYILFILIILLGTSINITPEEGNFDFTGEKSSHPITGFASWIDTHHLASERDKPSNGRVGSEAELFAILDSGLAFQMSLPLVGADEAMHYLKIKELGKIEEAKKLAALEKAQKEKAEQEQDTKEKLVSEKTVELIVPVENKEETPPIALEKPAEKETTVTTSSDTNVVDTVETKPVLNAPIDLISDNVDMTQYSVISNNTSYEAIFTLVNKGDDVQAGRITFSMSFEDGRTIPFTGYLGSYRFKMQVPKNYTLEANEQMIEHAKVAAPRLLTIYLINNREEVFFRKNIMITN